jgi:PRTRC genetic system protein E
MFVELMPLLAGRVVCIMASRIDDHTMRVILLPKPAKEGENTALCTPLCFTGTPQELDTNFSQQLTTYATCHASLGSTLAEAVAQMEAAAKTAREEAKRKAKPKACGEAEKPAAATSPSATTPTTVTASPMGLFDNLATPADSAPIAGQS